jgi:hypothetical protein
MRWTSMIMGKDLEEAVVVYFKVLSHNSFKRTEKYNAKHLDQNS